MSKILILLHSEELANILQSMLSCKFDVHICLSGAQGAQRIRELQPKALIIGMMLPYKDGLTVLDEVHDCLPPVVLGLTSSCSEYALYGAAQRGVGYMMLDNCEAKNMVNRLLEMIACTEETPLAQEEPRSKATKRLLELGFHTGKDGFRQLQMSIPLYAGDTAQRVCKEIYPAVAQLGGYNSGEQVEHAIRTAINDAWKVRDRELWAHYFPGNQEKCPSNKKFISRMAANL